MRVAHSSIAHSQYLLIYVNHIYVEQWEEQNWVVSLQLTLNNLMQTAFVRNRLTESLIFLEKEKIVNPLFFKQLNLRPLKYMF